MNIFFFPGYSQTLPPCTDANCCTFFFLSPQASSAQSNCTRKNCDVASALGSPLGILPSRSNNVLLGGFMDCRSLVNWLILPPPFQGNLYFNVLNTIYRTFSDLQFTLTAVAVKVFDVCEKIGIVRK
jgi:hypothetical protein